MDEAMAREGGIRRHVPLYTTAGEEVPLAEVKLHANDVISIQQNVRLILITFFFPSDGSRLTAQLSCGLWTIGAMTGFNLRRNLRSVTLFEKAPPKTAGGPGGSYGAPFKL